MPSAAAREFARDLLAMPRPHLLAFGEAVTIERSWREAAEITGSKWPVGYCVDASMDLRDVLVEKYPDLGAEFVWGRFALRPPRFSWEHAWVRIDGGTILDLTASQFIPEQPKESTVIVCPDDPLAAVYVENERDPAWARSWKEDR